MEWVRELDYAILRAINLDMSRSWLDPIVWTITSTGLGWVQLVLSLTVWKATNWRPLIAMAISNLVFVGLLVGAMKRFVPRDRPSQLIDTLVAVDEKLTSGSFPSGHTTGAFAMATCIAFLSIKNERRWIGMVAMLWALLVGLSRIYRGLHWPTDVFAGSCLGIACGAIIFTLIDSIVARKERGNSIEPVVATSSNFG